MTGAEVLILVAFGLVALLVAAAAGLCAVGRKVAAIGGRVREAGRRRRAGRSALRRLVWLDRGLVVPGEEAVGSGREVVP